ncbi:M48 family metallopeptidase [Laspinema sp. D1]|uniref:M48 family metallopeptidase n=1 Tax=Laspinema palackyanum D2a TaxID=2953684 RepID=A0ABT2MYM8_9CYAN|nr:M48 family metallopeptidase [Laspinema sp. D2a]
MHLSEDNIRLAVISRLCWIKKQRANFEAQPRQSKREMVSGESHYVFGDRYRLFVIERQGRHEIALLPPKTLQLFVNSGILPQNRALVLTECYRAQLRARIPDLLEKWQPIIGHHVADWGVKK